MAITQEVKEAIMAVSDRNGGLLRPEDVVEAARSEASPLHPLFEWDAKKAANSYRIMQACTLIRRVRVEIVTTNLIADVKLVPAFGRNTRDGGYATLDYLRKDDDMARGAAVAEFQKAAAALRRAQGLAVELGLGQEAHATIAALIKTVSASGEEVFGNSH